MSQINRPPVGLQSLLGSKNFGANPSDLAQQVIPIADLFPFWASQTLRFDKQTGTSSGAGSLIEVQVPSGKTWGILSCAFQCESTPANDDFILSVAIDENLTGTDWYIVASEVNGGNLDGGILPSVVWTPPQLFWLPPEYSLRGILDTGSTVATRDFELHTVYYELDV